MSDPAYAFQVGQAAALLATTALTDIVAGRVVDPIAAPNAAYPFVEIGDDQVLGDDNTCGSQSEIYSTVHYWAKGPTGRLVVKQMAETAHPTLSNLFALSGHVMLTAKFESSTSRLEGDGTDPDSLVAHGISVFHYRTRPANP